MNIEVNGELKTLQASKLADALVELGYEQSVVATALNGEFVSVDQRSSLELNDGDRLEVLAPMQGG